MKINLNKAWVIAKINFQHLKLTYIITAILVLAGCESLIEHCISSSDKYVAIGNYLYITLNFKRIMHLNGKKLDFHWGTLINSTIISAVVSLTNIILFLMLKDLSIFRHTSDGICFFVDVIDGGLQKDFPAVQNDQFLRALSYFIN